MQKVRLSTSPRSTASCTNWFLFSFSFPSQYFLYRSLILLLEIRLPFFNLFYFLSPLPFFSPFARHYLEKLCWFFSFYLDVSLQSSSWFYFNLFLYLLLMPYFPQLALRIFPQFYTFPPCSVVYTKILLTTDIIYNRPFSPIYKHILIPSIFIAFYYIYPFITYLFNFLSSPVKYNSSVRMLVSLPHG